VRTGFANILTTASYSVQSREAHRHVMVVCKHTRKSRHYFAVNTAAEVAKQLISSQHSLVNEIADSTLVSSLCDANTFRRMHEGLASTARAVFSQLQTEEALAPEEHR